MYAKEKEQSALEDIIQREYAMEDFYIKNANMYAEETEEGALEDIL